MAAASAPEARAPELSPYDPVIERQQQRIEQLERELERSSAKLRLLKTRHLLQYGYDPLAPPGAGPLWRGGAGAGGGAGVAAAAVAAAAAVGGAGVPGVGGAGAVAGLPPPLLEEDERAGKTRYWTEMEHNQFLWAVTCFGPKNYVAISQFVGTRTPKQVRTHAQKYQMKLEREASKRRATAAAMEAASGRGKGSESGRENACGMSAGMGVGAAGGDCGAGTGTTPSSSTPAVGTGFDWWRDVSCSPLSNDSSEDDFLLGELAEEEAVGSSPLAMHHGLKKNSSLGNLADYDEFYKKITNVADQRLDRDATENIEDDLLDTGGSRSEHFEDALLNV